MTATNTEDLSKMKKDDPRFKKACKEEWDRIHRFTSVGRFYEKLRVTQKTVELGFLDLNIGWSPYGIFQVRGIMVKLLNGKAHLNFPTSGAQHWPDSFPKTSVLREVLTLFAFQSEEIKTALDNVEKMTTEAEEGAEDAPASEDTGYIEAGAEDSDPNNPFNS